MWKYLGIVMLMSLSSLGFAEEKSRPSGKEMLPKADLRKFQACDHDSDCVRATNGCCDCANGGEMIAVHRKHEKAVRDLFPCKGVLCTEKAGECMHWLPVCAKGLCDVVPPKKK